MSQPTDLDPLRMRSVLGRKEWGVPTEFGPAGWRIQRNDGTREILASSAFIDDAEYIHASIAGTEMPDYEDLALMHRAVFGDGYAYQVFAPPDQHMNIHATALHLWGRVDGRPTMPEFGRFGTI